MDQGELEALPEPAVLHLATSDGQVLVTWGHALVYRYEVEDIGMRNLAIVALTDAGRRVDEVARVFDLTATYVSMLRGRARLKGSAGLVRRRGRPRKLSERQVAQARAWAGSGWTQQAISERLGVARSVISDLLARVGPAPVQQALPATSNTEPEPTVAEPDDTDTTETETETEATPVVAFTRIETGSYRCRYAGAMLLYPYLHRVGAQAIFATLTSGPGRRYGDLGVLTTATLGFALGAGTVEGTKHLGRAEAGAAVGLAMTPELATLRTRLSALADASDPLGLQRAFAAGMLAADPAAEALYFVDDHFVPYSGARPVAKGWNTKRRHAGPGVLAQLRQVLGPDAPILLGFDQGGAHPSAFTTCRDGGAGWVSYRRGPLVATTATPVQATIWRAGAAVQVMLADEAVQIKGYGAARQLTLFEDDAPVLQILTSDTTATSVGLLYWLQARWRIENTFTCAAQHNGIDTLSDYAMDIGPDTRKVTNPARIAARKAVAAAQAELATAKRALPQLLAGEGTPRQKNAALPGVHRRIDAAIVALEGAKTALRPVPAKVLATDLDPDAKRTRPHIARRGLQMVLRLLAFNAEAWLAEHFNAYLGDPNEYRAILRKLLHLGGQLDYTTKAITITLDRPDSPQVARALQLLTEELNAIPATMPGDHRPLTYQLAET